MFKPDGREVPSVIGTELVLQRSPIIALVAFRWDEHFVRN